MQAFLPLLVVVLCALVSAQQWNLDGETLSTTLVGCGVGSATQAIGAASKSGQGAFVDLYTGDNTWNQKGGEVQAGLLMDAAISGDGKVSIITSMYSILVSTDSSASYSAVPGVGGPLQGAYMFNGNSMAAVGNMAILPSSGLTPGSVSGIAVSTDGAGEVWSAIQVMDETNCRYGAFPSANTWYVSAGMWNTNTTSDSVTAHAPMFHVKTKEAGSGIRLSRNVHIGELSTKKVQRGIKGKSDSSTGWWGSIYKTTDAGATFTNVYNSPADSTWYFNMISCGSETTCMAAAEGDNADGSPYAGLWVTTDGGANWSESWTGASVGLMAVKMTSATNGFFAPAFKSGFHAPYSEFYYTTDSGASWTLQQTLENCVVMDLDQVDTLGAATCIYGQQMELATFA